MRYGTQRVASLIATPNLAPLVDVLLVLLALVITTLPMAQATGLLAFQQRTSCPPWPASSPQPINLRIDAAGAVFWNGQPLDGPALQQYLAQAQQMPQQHRPWVHLATSDDTDYADMARVLLAVSQHGLRVDAAGN
ncbi:TPA: biopolymer transporter ExbD [Stenotrophomonas maltophilia]|jgi:biopolymer transport protein ExbD|uniref:Biopolymer transporter ExbD n=1 Tax=Stenotrophomonas maltophilia TaxID=40324 RepID=A0A2J0UD16_STEMA|nr:MULTISPECIES: biopolymer transporter ExbD [Stenotrophomonas]PJL31347.1 biopolymer transporter ExbD [Stenotrophomonas maltophilia]HDS1137757.1 biopolymer transporter ExbD [Stenotrophomonas maltophilia]HDS1147065.1 biopolymer transporter ExbD [Stenotrophomonas maltophilia]HDS1161623.1 biopolymer transporter ExbD [Stenotrophomonas maltophilia]HEL5401354.1 biopolymer transporter ExbD [Stenotrophomonas maltophilia]